MATIAPFPSISPKQHEEKLQHPERLAALETTGLMDTLPEHVFDRAVRLATEMIGAPIGLMALVDGERQFFKAQIGLPEHVAATRQTSLRHSFCQYVVTAGEPLAVVDAREHELLRNNLAVPELGVVAYLGIPIRTPDGQAVGSFCAIDVVPHEWSEREQRVLTDIAGMVESEIALRQEAASRQLLVCELNHRVKNLFAVVGGMIELTSRMSATPEEMAKAVRGRIVALSRAHELIRPAVTLESAKRADVSLQALVSALIEPHLNHANDHLTIDGPTLTLGASAATKLTLVLHELATNAGKYGALSVQEGWLEVTWKLVNERLVLDWSETSGPPIAAPPLRRGFGSKLIEMTVTGHLHGELETEWRARGVHHRITVPLVRLEA